MDSLKNEEKNEQELTDDVSQSIRNTAKKRLKALSEKNTKLNETTSSPIKVNPAFLSLYSDEELESNSVVTQIEPEKELSTVSLVVPKVNDEINGKRLYRTDRTKNTDSELSEGEIVDDEEDDTLSNAVQKEEEPQKSVNNPCVTSKDSVPPHFPNNRMMFDLRQRIQTKRGRFRGNIRATNFDMRRRRSNSGFRRRSRSRSHRRHTSREKRKSNEKKTPTKTRESKASTGKTSVSEAAQEVPCVKNTNDPVKSETKLETNKHSKKKDKKHERKFKEKPLLETAKELTTFLPDDDDDIKELKRKIIGLQAELAGQGNVAAKSDEGTKTTDISERPKTPKRESSSTLTSPIKRNEEKKSQHHKEKRPESTKKPRDKPVDEKVNTNSLKDGAKDKSHASHVPENENSDKKASSENVTNANKNEGVKKNRSRSRTPKMLPKSQGEKNVSELKKIQNVCKSSNKEEKNVEQHQDG